MAVETRPQEPVPHSSDNTALILAAIDRVAADSRSSNEQLAADSRSNYDRLSSDMRSNYERLSAEMRSNNGSLRADIRQLYYLNILTLLTALGALIAGLFALLSG